MNQPTTSKKINWKYALGETIHLQNNIQAFERKIIQIGRVMPYLNGRQEGRDSTSRKISFRAFMEPTILPLRLPRME